MHFGCRAPYCYLLTVSLKLWNHMWDSFIQFLFSFLWQLPSSRMIFIVITFNLFPILYFDFEFWAPCIFYNIIMDDQSLLSLKLLLLSSRLLSIFSFRTNGENYPRKITSHCRSLPPHLSHSPGVQRSGTTASSRKTAETTDRTAKHPHSLPARSRSSMAAQHSQYSESDKRSMCRLSALSRWYITYLPKLTGAWLIIGSACIK